MIVQFGYDPAQFAHIKGSIGSVDSICHHAVYLYATKLNFGGELPQGAKTSYAKEILLHHPDKSLKTTRNVVSAAIAVQVKYRWLLEIYYETSVAPYVVIVSAVNHLKNQLTQDLT